MTVKGGNPEIPLGGGLDTKTNEKLLQPPACADLVDAIFPSSGIAGYETRPGYERIRTATEATTVDTLGTRESELFAVADDRLYSVSELANNVDLIDRGSLLACKVDQTPLDMQAVNQTGAQICEHNGIRVHVYYNDSVLRYSVTDVDSGAAIVTGDQVASNSTKAKLLKFDSSIHILYFEDSGTTLSSLIIPTYDPTSATDTEIVTDIQTNGLFDCVEMPNNTAFVVYNRFATNNLAAGLIISESANINDSNLSIQNSAGTPYTAMTCAYAAATQEYLVFTSAGTSIVCSYSNTGNSILTIGTFAAGTSGGVGTVKNLAAVAYSSRYVTVFAEIASSGSSPFDTAQFNEVFCMEVNDVAPGTWDSLLDSATYNTVIKNACLVSGAFYLDDTVTTDSVAYAWICYDSPLQSTNFLVDQTADVAAKCCQGQAYGAITDAHLPRVIDKIFPAVYQVRFELDLDPTEAPVKSDSFGQYGIKRVYLDDSYKPSAVEYGRSAYIAGGITWGYDGYQRYEQGFLIYPETFDDTTSTAGNLTQGADYAYRIYYEWTNARGERQRSSTAQVYTVSLGASDDDVTLEIPTLGLTHKGNDVSIVIYRTEANPNVVGGAPFYRVTDPDPSVTGDNGFLANDTTAATVTWKDILSDTDLIKKELDYKNTGELDNVVVPEGHIIGESKNRVWLAGSEKYNRVYFSKLNSRGNDQLEFNDTRNYLDVPEDGGAITAIGALNFHTVIFKEDSIYAVSGEGPNNLGFGQFNLPQIVSLDVGCVDQRSVVNVPAGIMFKSNKGIWLVGHNLDTQYVGDRVEAYNSQDVTSATIDPDKNHVIFLTSSGSALCYNYLVNEWSRFSNHAGNDAVMWNGTYTYARTDGKIYKQSSTYSDDGVFYSMSFTTAPISLAGPQGYQRIRSLRLLGEYYSPHSLRVRCRYNHEPGPTETATWDPADALADDAYGEGAYGAGAYGGTGDPVYQARFNLPRQKCQTVQFIIDTTNTSGAGRSVSIQALQIEGGRKFGNFEVQSAKAFTGE